MTRISFVPLLVRCLIMICASLPAVAASEEEERLRQAVEHYFEVWSQADMESYQNCFHPQAVISYVAEDGRVHPLGLLDFVNSQREAHRLSTLPMRERPLHIEIERHGRFATACVFWELLRGVERTTGVNLFSFAKVEDRWVIVSLVYGAEVAVTPDS
jgi:hypothetical protein